MKYMVGQAWLIRHWFTAGLFNQAVFVRAKHTSFTLLSTDNLMHNAVWITVFFCVKSFYELIKYGAMWKYSLFVNETQPWTETNQVLNHHLRDTCEVSIDDDMNY